MKHEKFLKDCSDEYLNSEGVGYSGVVDINMTSAVSFVVIASCFLVMLYKFMSLWFIEVLVVLFCIGGVEGLQTCLVALLSSFRYFRRAGKSYQSANFWSCLISDIGWLSFLHSICCCLSSFPPHLLCLDWSRYPWYCTDHHSSSNCSST